MRPEPRLLGLLAFCGVPAILAAFVEPATPFALAAPALVAAVFVIDAWLGRRPISIGAERVVAGALALGTWSPVRIKLRNDSARDLDLDVYDHHPARGETRGMPCRIGIPRGETGVVTYRFRPLRRGDGRFSQVELLARSPWRFWRVRRRLPVASPVKVFPDFSSVRRYAVLAVEDALAPAGVRERHKRGEGLELHQLREYREGDALRQIDWKATSRRDHVISRQYEDERNQQVVFLLDCGWRMRAIDDGEVHFDCALNSLLLLTYVAVRRGDAVGLMTMAGEDRWLPPQKGPSAMRQILQAVYDLETRTAQPDFARAASRLMARQPRRALVIILSNLNDEDSEEAALAARLMRRRHLVLFASLREAALDATIEAPVTDLREALRVGATRHYLIARHEAHERLRGRGVATLDVTPAELPLAIVNRYLEIKRSGTL